MFARVGAFFTRLRELIGNFMSFVLNLSKKTLYLAAICGLIFGIWISIEQVEVSSHQVLVRVNNVTGSQWSDVNVGTYFIPKVLYEHYIFAKDYDELYMTAHAKEGDLPWEDNLNFITRDGGQASLEVTVVFQIVPEKAHIVAQNFGIEAQKMVDRVSGCTPYKNSVLREAVRAFSREILRRKFGELTIEQLYHPDLRQNALDMAKHRMNERLNPLGIRVTNVAYTELAFFKEYQDAIDEKIKLSQVAKEWENKQGAAREDQKKQVTQANKELITFINELRGQLEKVLEEKRGQSEEVMREADGYAFSKRQEADARFIEKKNQAAGIQAQAISEAEGLKAKVEAFRGEGGRRLVQRAWVTKPKRVRGQPFSVNPVVNRFQVENQPVENLVPAVVNQLQRSK